VSEPRFPFVVVDVAPEEADEAGAHLFELGAEGVEERDATTLVKGAEGRATLVASFASHGEAIEAIEAIDPSWSPRLEEVVGDAWRDAWKEHFRPFALCDGIVVRPPWEAYDAGPKERVLELEPGRAFGTGLHETTSLVAAALARHQGALRDRDVLDVGCGSGILALVALLLGAARARCVDNDPDVIDVARENAARNGVGPRLVADATDVAALDGAYAAVVANIEADVLVRLAAPIMARCAPGALLVLSGVLAPQRDRVREAYAAFELVEAPAKGEWVAIVLRRPAA